MNMIRYTPPGRKFMSGKILAEAGDQTAGVCKALRRMGLKSFFDVTIEEIKRPLLMRKSVAKYRYKRRLED